MAPCAKTENSKLDSSVVNPCRSGGWLTSP